MSRIDNLIVELCPNGVKFEELGNIGVIYGGLTGKNKSDFSNGNTRFISYMNVYNNLAVNLQGDDFVQVGDGENQNNIKFGDVLFTGSSETPDDVGMTSVVMEEPVEAIYLNSFCFGYRLSNINLLLPGFLKYVFYSDAVRKGIAKSANGATRFNISKSRLLKVSIPIPPLEVQREILKVLDTFTELEAELEAELKLRQKQYQYYRDKLFIFNDEKDLKWMTLGEVAKNLDSQRKPVAKSKRKAGSIPYYGASGIVDYVEDYIFEGDFLLVSEDGANLLARSTPIAFSISGKTWVNNHAHVLQFETYVERRFIEIYLNSIDLTPFISGGAQPKLNQANLNKIPVPAPTYDEQARIVNILDKFDTLVNDLSSGLPAEINARRKQYEHYKDRLLTFKEAV